MKKTQKIEITQKVYNKLNANDIAKCNASECNNHNSQINLDIARGHRLAPSKQLYYKLNTYFIFNFVHIQCFLSCPYLYSIPHAEFYFILMKFSCFMFYYYGSTGTSAFISIISFSQMRLYEQV